MTALSRRAARRQDTGGGRAPAIVLVLILFAGFVAYSVEMKREGLLAARTAIFAQQSMRELAEAEAKYAKTYGGFSSSLQDLAAPPGGKNTSATSAGLIREGLAGGSFSGYAFVYTPSEKNSMGLFRGYTICGRPSQTYSLLKTPQSYFVDQTGVLRFTKEDRCPGPGDLEFPF